MDELVPNPDNCRCFDPNPFKKEKCKNCGRLWTEHKGVIDPKHVNAYVRVRQKAAEDKAKLEAQAKAKEDERRQARVKRDQAVEDEWLFDGTKDAKADSDDDNEMGFRMLMPGDLMAPSMCHTVSEGVPVRNLPSKPLKVVNLIDFGECDLPEDAGATSGGSTAASATALSGIPPGDLDVTRVLDRSPPLEAKEDLLGVTAPAVLAHARSMSSFGGGRHEGITELEVNNSRLMSENEYLRQMLANAKEETNIQVEIIRDEVVEKKKLVEALQAQLKQRDEALQTAEEGVKRGTEQHGAEAKAILDDAERLRHEVTSLRSELAERDTEAEGLRTEVAKLRADLAATQSSRSEETDRLRLQVADLKAALSAAEKKSTEAVKNTESVRAGANSLSEENKRLTAALAAVQKEATEAASQVKAEANKAKLAAEVMSRREAALALRELRINADKRLEWFLGRLNTPAA